MTELERLLQQAESALSALMQKNEREKKFATESRLRFEKNINAFGKYYPKIASILKEYKPREDFEILVTSTGVGNFVPKDVGVPIYSDDPLAQCREQLKKNTSRGYYSLTQYGFAVSDNDNRLHSRYMAELSNTIQGFQQKNPTQLSTLPKHFPTAIIFGVGLGYVVTDLLESHSFDYIYVSEPDLEIFYASLFCTDWAKIIEDVDEAGGTLFLQIGLDVKEFFNSLYSFAHDIGPYSIIRAFCYQHYPSVEVNKQIAAFFNRYYELQAGFGFYNDAITGLAHCIKNYESKAQFLRLPSKRCYLSMPAIIVGNGPSLDAASEVLKEIQDKVIIFACGTALGSLARQGIKADFHVLVERPKTTYDALMDSFDPSYYSDLNLLAVDVIYPDVVDLYDWVGLGLKGPEAATVFSQFLMLEDYKQIMPSLTFPGPLVANTALSFAFTFGFEEVYLFGVDNGYLNGKTHSENSIYAHNENYKKIVDKGAVHKLKGNISQDVMSTNLLMLAHKHIESLIALDKKVSVYNVGEGAFIEGAFPIVEDDVFVRAGKLEKSQVINDIKQRFFYKPVFNVNDERLAFKLFDDICEHLNDIASEPYSTRKEASDILKRQARYVYSFRKTRFAHLFHLIKGSLLYYHCPMLTLLYQYEDEQVSLDCFTALLALWKDYVRAMKADYRQSWNKKCDWGMDIVFANKNKVSQV
ncbi:6-hydroxymethylpterin diphosphokinase MptE-like protein [Rheinheimera pleomorphica]|uniref:motility associated factor glycosyltransferase family protein n=1 Tax=Rheinheimera pleomorphica TaxID=2703963 RepID=UPI001421D611|nr:6-hydroxymethylpterin diphosphokinase MptE-like protein [Rheinheimera pleomorphica]